MNNFPDELKTQIMVSYVTEHMGNELSPSLLLRWVSNIQCKPNKKVGFLIINRFWTSNGIKSINQTEHACYIRPHILASSFMTVTKLQLVI